MKVRLTGYTPNWKTMYKEEQANLRCIFGKEILSFEHFGSTAIPGMLAKPVVDMMCIVKDIYRIDSYNTYMDGVGYDIAGEWGIEGRRLFRKGGVNRSHHIHVYQYGNPQIDRHLILRDYLLQHSSEAAQYSAFKEKIAKRYTYTSEYSKAKKQFVSDLENRALWWKEKSLDG
ncbi:MULTISPECIES: GrpB family protein [Oceanobacillus]|uniref:GrpB family protein n=1 Tax=Oceanobacillus kimchii TaxID=746691 RepID=A0ABQ5TE06_9BACI|nr:MULTISPECIES: GrpB family protein [Oceanobacillus]MBT2653109.1 GrpB family protein [Oceanobacillus sp. ISL-73]GLO64565.1 hypothetical protein MACH08_03490 [Oceanobacillus kimchii]